MEVETVSLGVISPPDSACHFCTKRHTCGLPDSPLASSPRRVAAPVPVEEARVQVPVYEIDNGEHSRTCIRRILIGCIMVLLILILVVIILRSIF